MTTPPEASADSESLANPTLWLAFALMLFVSGFCNTFPVFFPALLEEFGGSRAATASTVSLLWAGGALVGALAGYLVARYDPRWVVIAGLLAMVAGLLLATRAPTLTSFVILLGTLGGIGIGLTGMVTQAALLADTYVRRRGVANGIAFSGSMAGYFAALPAQMIITRAGWRGAFVVYVLVLLALVPISWRILPARLASAAADSAGRARGSVRAIVTAPAFWVLITLFVTPPLVAYLATMQHAVYFQARGFSAGEASAMLTVGGVLGTAGRILAGVATDRFGAPAAGVLSFVLSITGLLCLIGMEVGSPSRLLAYVSIFFVFLPIGSRATIVSVLVNRIASPAQYGVVFGLLGISNSLGAGMGPILSGAIYDRTHSYAAIYVTSTAFLLVGLGALLLFVAMTRPRRQN